MRFRIAPPHVLTVTLLLSACAKDPAADEAAARTRGGQARSSATPERCLSLSLEEVKSCQASRVNTACGALAASFLSGCLEGNAGLDAYCAGVPPRLHVFKSRDFFDATCKQHDLPSNAACHAVVKRVQLTCRDRAQAAK